MPILSVPEPEIIRTVRELISAGASEKEIVRTLTEMGLTEEEAKKLILVAQKDILLTLRNELKEMAREVLSEEKPRFLGDILEKLKKIVENSRKEVEKSLWARLKEPVARIGNLEDRMDSVEKNIMDLRHEISEIKGAMGKVVFRGYLGMALGIGLIALGSALLVLTFFSLSASAEMDFLLLLIKIAVSAIILIGGVSLLS